MPLARFLVTIDGDATNRAGYEAGSEWHLSDADARARLERGEVELVAPASKPSTTAKQSAPAKSEK